MTDDASFQQDGRDVPRRQGAHYLEHVRERGVEPVLEPISTSTIGTPMIKFERCDNNMAPVIGAIPQQIISGYSIG